MTPIKAGMKGRGRKEVGKSRQAVGEKGGGKGNREERRGEERGEGIGGKLRQASPLLTSRPDILNGLGKGL